MYYKLKDLLANSNIIQNAFSSEILRYVVAAFGIHPSSIQQAI